MKKILSIFAAAAVLLGLASCSGDLHDDIIKPLYIEGAVTPQIIPDNGDDPYRSRVAVTMIDDTHQQYKFTYDTAMSDDWGSPAGGVCFKLMKSASGWSDDFGGEKDTALEVVVNADDYVKLNQRDAENSNPGNITVYGLTDGEEYTMHILYDASASSVQLKISGNATSYPDLTVAVGTSKPVNMTRSGTDYQYLYTSDKDGEVTFTLSSGVVGWNGTEITVGESVSSTGEIMTDTPDAFSFTAEKDVVYLITTKYTGSFPDLDVAVNYATFAKRYNMKKTNSSLCGQVELNWEKQEDGSFVAKVELEGEIPNAWWSEAEENSSTEDFKFKFALFNGEDWAVAFRGGDGKYKVNGAATKLEISSTEFEFSGVKGTWKNTEENPELGTGKPGAIVLSKKLTIKLVSTNSEITIAITQ